MNKITNLLCLSFLLLGATGLGMNPSFASSLASRGQVKLDAQLIEAAESGNFEDVQTLIRQGASIEAKGVYGRTAFYYAATSGHERICKLLIENRASIEAQDTEESTPLLCAAAHGKVNVCKLLIDAQLESAKKKKEARTAIKTFLGIMSKRGQYVQCLMQYDVAKMIAQLACKTVQEMIVSKPFIGTKNIYGKTALNYALCNGHKDVCKLLIDVQLEPIRKDKAAILTFLGVSRKRGETLPSRMPYDVTKIIGRQLFARIQRDKQPVIDQINGIRFCKIRTLWLAYLNQQMNSAIH